MALIAWNERFATGISMVDDQHRTLFTTVNEFHAGLVAGQARQQISKTLDFLVDYTIRHFKTEEEFMEKCGFPGTAGHRTEHALLLQEVAAFREQWTANPGSVRPMEVARFLGDWLTHHIQAKDLEYAFFLKERGLVKGGALAL
jgi:methyl-accepting chemotaxis protein/hemerythrin